MGSTGAECAAHRPVLYRLEEQAGHGLGTTKSTRDAEEADTAAFMVGRAATERPDLFAGAIVRIGDVNALRMETMAAGPGNIPEFGTVKDSQGFRDLYEMDAYQHVVRLRPLRREHTCQRTTPPRWRRTWLQRPSASARAGGRSQRRSRSRELVVQRRAHRLLDESRSVPSRLSGSADRRVRLLARSLAASSASEWRHLRTSARLQEPDVPLLQIRRPAASAEQALMATPTHCAWSSSRARSSGSA